MPRGKLILFEGLDRTGKTTQASIVVEKLKPKVEFVRFPDRSTQVGKIIDRYLKKSDSALSDQAIHLLFSANRWELAPKMNSLLQEGYNVVIDRYVYSGIAYSAAKGVPGMDLEWCVAPEHGLPKPDLVFFLTNGEGVCEEREGFGEERYENVAFQLRVAAHFRKVFSAIEDPQFVRDRVHFLAVSGLSIEEVSAKVWPIVQACLDRDVDEQQFF